MRALVVPFLLLLSNTAEAQKAYLPSNFKGGCTTVSNAQLTATVCHDIATRHVTVDGQLLAGSNTPNRRFAGEGTLGFCDDMTLGVYCEDYIDYFCDDWTIYEVRNTALVQGVNYLVDGPALSARACGATANQAIDNLISFSASQAEFFRVTSDAPQFPSITNLHQLPVQNIAHSSQLGSLTGQLTYDAAAGTLVFTNSRGLRVTADASGITLRYVSNKIIEEIPIPSVFGGNNINAIATKLVRFGIIRALGNKEWNDDWFN